MLTHLQAERIVKRSVRHVRGFDGAIPSEQTLQQAGIITAGLVEQLRETLALDTNIGVPSVPNHRIDISDISASIGTRVLQLQNTVLFFAHDITEATPPIARMSVTVSRADRRAAGVVATAEIREDAGGERPARSTKSARKGRKGGGAK
jgi:hypothetical protein